MTQHFPKRVRKNNEQTVYDNKYHYSNPLTLYPKSRIRKLLDHLAQSLYQNHFENIAKQEGSSSHTAEFINTIYIKCHETDPTGVRSYTPTPKPLENKKAVINPQINDDKCFLYATTISIFYNYLHKKNPGRINKKLPNYCKLLNFDNINFPPAIKHIQQFEKDNPTISITIFEFGGIKKIDDDNNDDDDDNDDNNNNANNNNNNAFTNIEKYHDSETTIININTN